MDKIIPKNGVYAVQLNIENSPFLGMMNIGTNPTVNGNNKSIEIHIINWIGNLYGRSIKVNIIDRVRNEVKFDSIADLREQLEKDKHYILDKFNTLTL
jgi:riboflavin kinase/FMN adenylyltransferase